MIWKGDTFTLKNGKTYKAARDYRINIYINEGPFSDDSGIVWAVPENRKAYPIKLEWITNCHGFYGSCLKGVK